MPYEHTFFKEAFPMATATWEIQRLGRARMSTAGQGTRARRPVRRQVHRPVRRVRHPASVGAHHALATRGRALRAAQARFRRRRLAVAVAFLLLAAAGWLLALVLALPLRSGAEAAAPIPAAQVVVGPGDTVWDLARAHAPEGVDPLVYVAEVVEHNGVPATALVPGMVLELPAG